MTIQQKVSELKTQAINAGFDWPTQYIEDADEDELEEFFEEMTEFILEA